MKKFLFFAALLLTTTSFAQRGRLKRMSGNPILPEFHADPEIMFSHQTGRFYIYSTTDGAPGWGGYYFTAFSSPDLVEWKHEGIILDLATKQVPWATGNAWAPAIIEKETAGQFKYYFYYSGHDPLTNRKAIGVAVAETPTGPFYDHGSPIVNKLPEGVNGGQQIDVDVFQDPQTGKNYLYWGNGYMAVAELNRDMVSIDTTTIRVLTPKGGSLQDYQYREAPYVFYRNGLYYFLWSVDDTGSPNYHVAYGTAASPLGPINIPTQPIVLQQDPQNEIYGTAHNSVINVPGYDDWYIVYHRINPAYLDRKMGPGFHRQVCIDRLLFDKDGAILPVRPSHSGVAPVKPKKLSKKKK
ncbi:MAG: family 43 glycosylhydrolase [Bacteroidaceae bacterium]|nr:family 43 glycosylhydrolase [Bacteroidaceae bacterium]